MKYLLFLFGVVLATNSFAGTINGKICRVEMSPASMLHHVAVGMVKSGANCPTAASGMEWKYFYGVNNSQGLTTNLWTEAELQTVFNVMLQTKIEGGSVNISYKDSFPQQAMYFIFL